MTSPVKGDHQAPTLSTEPQTNPSCTLLDLAPKLQLRIFETLDQGTSILLGLTCKRLYSIHRGIYKFPTNLMTSIDYQDEPSYNGHSGRYYLINYLVDWFPIESSNIAEAYKEPPPPGVENRSVVVRLERWKRDFANIRFHYLPTVPRFSDVKILRRVTQDMLLR
ncbi:hypothetical protein HYALB_00004560 [Hymenoscyphus albidus]|uniref:F-box domain-containing protein n=1 Tax=Hymenoscyphus albidus TaxID=595503 RepID=A0A9N9QD25_9HELO|nr:hypothetical protein HYALB_00004560 [Hymenoscyphus albidus]